MEKIDFCITCVLFVFPSFHLVSQDLNRLQGLSFLLGFDLFLSSGRFESLCKVNLAIPPQFLVRCLAPPLLAIHLLVLSLGLALGWFFIQILLPPAEVLFTA
jgi:hypothetical protein